MSVGIDLANKQVIFKLYRNSSSTPEIAGFPLSGYEHYDFYYALRYMIGGKTNGYVDSTYNPEGINFSISSNSITGIVLEIESGVHRLDKTKRITFINSGTTLWLNDFVMSGDQKLIIKSHDENPVIFTQASSLSSAIDSITGLGLSAYDLIWDGINKGQTLVDIEYAISGTPINTSDSGTIFFLNKHGVDGFPDGYDYNGNQTLTANINNNYYVFRFGNVKQGLSGWHIPTIYSEDGRLADAYENNPCVIYYYDLIRWLNKELPVNKHYEIMMVYDTNINSGSNNYCTDATYSTTIGALSSSTYNSYRPIYEGTNTGSSIGSYEFFKAKPWQGGQYLKVKASEWDSIKLILSASYLLPDELILDETSPKLLNLDNLYYTSGASESISGYTVYDLNIEINNLQYCNIGQWSFDPSSRIGASDFSSSFTGWYYTDVSTTAMYYKNSYLGFSEVSSRSHSTLSGYPYNYTDRWKHDYIISFFRNFSSCNISNMTISGALGIYGMQFSFINASNSLNPQYKGSITGLNDINIINCNFYNYLGKSIYFYNNVFNNETGKVDTFSYPSSGIVIDSCNFYNCGDVSQILLDGFGPNSKIINNNLINCAYFTYHNTKHGIGLYNNSPYGELIISGNNMVNNYIYTGICKGDFLNNNIEYNITVDDYDKFKSGGKNGITIHSSVYWPSESYKICDNNITNVPEDAILIEGVGPWNSWGRSFSSPYYSYVPLTAAYPWNELEYWPRGCVAHITISGNLLTSQVTKNKGYADFGSSNKSSQLWSSNIWLSDCGDIDIYENIIIGSRNENGYDKGTDEWGQTITAAQNFAFILDSTSSVRIFNNKIAYCNDVFKLGWKSGGEQGENFWSISNENGRYWGYAGQVNDLEIHNNKIYNNSNKLFSFAFPGSVSSNLFLNSYFNAYNSSTGVQMTDEILNSLGQNKKNITAKPSGDTNLSSSNWKIYNNNVYYNQNDVYLNTFINKYDSYADISNTGWWLSDGAGFISFRSRLYYSHSLHRDYINNSFWMTEAIPVIWPRWWAENTGMKDGTISGNIFYGFDNDYKNIEWLVYMSDEESNNYVASTFESNPPNRKTSTQPYQRNNSDTSSALSYIKWINSSSGENWWLREVQSRSELGGTIYSPGSGMDLNTYIYHPDYASLPSSSDILAVPLLCRIYEDENNNSLFSLREWTNYLNNSTTGMRGSGNEVVDELPNLNYVFDINNPNEFLEPLSSFSNNSISALNYASFDQVYQYRRYPRKAIIFKNISSNSISGLEFNFLTNDFVIWDSLLPTTAAIIPAGEQFTVQFDFQPQSVGNVFGTLNISYIENGNNYTDIITSISGVGIDIPIANYYVATTGDDSNDGSITAPFATIKKAFGLCSSGELIYLREGSYSEHIGQYYDGAHANPIHGSANDWSWNITLAAYPGEEVIINRQIAATSFNQVISNMFLGLTGEKYFSFEDLIFDGSGATGSASSLGAIVSCSWHSSYIKFWNCEIKNRHDYYLPSDSKQFGIGVSTTGIEFWYCKVHDTDEHLFYVSSSTGGSNPTSPDFGERKAKNCKFMYNELYNAGTNYLGDFYYSRSHGFHGNNENTPARGLAYPNIENNLYEGNYVHNTMNTGILLGGHFSSTAQNNLCISCSSVGISDSYAACSGNVFYNNTAIKNRYAGLSISQSSSAAVIKNNILYGTFEFAYKDFSNTITANDTSIVTNNLTEDDSLSVSANNLFSTDPQMVDVNNNVYNLKSTSPCINYGYNISSLTSDFYNLQRTNDNDIGAIDYYYREPVLQFEKSGSSKNQNQKFIDLRKVVQDELVSIIDKFRRDPLKNYKLVEGWFIKNIKNYQGNGIANLPFASYSLKLLQKDILLNESYEWYFTYLLKDALFKNEIPFGNYIQPQRKPSKIINIYKFSYDILNSNINDLTDSLIDWILSQKSTESWSEINNGQIQAAPMQIKNIKIRVIESSIKYPEKIKTRIIKKSLDK